jgi:hypothetical protein
MSSASSLNFNDYLGCFFTALEKDLLQDVYGKDKVADIARKKGWYTRLQSPGHLLNAVISFRLALARTNKGQDKEAVTGAILETCEEAANKGTLPNHVEDLRKLLNLAMQAEQESSTCEGTESLEEDGSGTLATTENGGEEEQPVSAFEPEPKKTGFRSTLSSWNSSLKRSIGSSSETSSKGP